MWPCIIEGIVSQCTRVILIAYVRGVVRLHRVPTDIVFDKDTRFRAGFWKKLQEAFTTKLNFCSTFYIANNGQTKSITDPKRYAA